MPAGASWTSKSTLFNNLGGRHEVPPLHDRIVVNRIDAEKKFCRRNHYSRHRVSQGEIIAVGPGGRDEAGKLIRIDLKVGDTVLFGKWSGTEVSSTAKIS